MAKSLFEQLGGTYHKENGYLIPDLRLSDEEEQPELAAEEKTLSLFLSEVRVKSFALL